MIKMDWYKTHKRFRLHDDLGYFRSYNSRRRATQAITNLGPAISSGIWILIDSNDNSKSFIKLKENNDKNTKN